MGYEITVIIIKENNIEINFHLICNLFKNKRNKINIL